MKRNQWFRLAIFLISFAIFLALPLHQYWMLKYTKGRDVVIPVVLQTQENNDPGSIAFCCVETTAPAQPGATDLGSGYVFFDLSGETARFAGVAAKRKAVPENAPYLIVRDLKLAPDGKSYIVPIVLHYFAEDPAEAANLRMKIVKAKSIKLAVSIYPNGDYLVEKICLE